MVLSDLFSGVGYEQKFTDVDFCATSHKLQGLKLQSPLQFTRG